MDGVTNLSFRRLIREISGNSPPLFVSEFLSTGSSVFLTPANLLASRFDKEEMPFCMQIFGHSAEKLSAAAVQVEELGASFVELNAGCPAPKVANKGSGSGLLKDLPNLQRILTTIKAYITIPLYLKCRIGWDESSICIDEVLKIAEGSGVEQLTLHGRTKMQAYTGLADWNIIKRIAGEAKIPVIGNGDITTPQNAIEKLTNYNVKGIAIGRAALSNPWIFLQIENAINNKEIKRITTSDISKLVLRYSEIMEQDGMCKAQTLGRLKQLCSRLCSEYAAIMPDFRLKVLRLQNLDEFLDKFREII